MEELLDLKNYIQLLKQNPFNNESELSIYNKILDYLNIIIEIKQLKQAHENCTRKLHN